MHVYERALKSQKLDRIIIAVDSQETVEALKKYNAEVIMTSPKHQSGTDRIAEAVANFNSDIIINIQGDEPMLDPEMIDSLISLFVDKSVEMATLASTVITENDILNQNSVKVAIDKNHNAIGFYRKITDFSKQYFHHIGIYGYRKDMLNKFTKLEQSKNEKVLHLEQLRALDNGIAIRVAVCDFPYRGVDVKKDLEQLNFE